MLRRFALMFLLATSPVAAAPPAPLAPGTVERDASIITVPSESGIDGYMRHFADGIRIFENEKQIAVGIKDWKAYLNTKKYFSHKIKLTSHGNPIIVVESTWLTNNECCLTARVVSYHLRDDGLVDEVRVISNGVYWGQPPNPE